MNNRTFLVLIIVLSCVLLLLGGAFIGSALYLQGAFPSQTLAFATVAPGNALIDTPAPSGATLKKGSVAPDITVTTMAGETLKLSSFRGKSVILNFWASWCGPCTAEMKNIESIYKEYPENDLIILGVNQGESNETIKGYADLWNLSFRLVRDEDGNAGRSYQIRALPTTVFIDSEGIVYEIRVGGPLSVDFIKERVNKLLDKSE